MMLSLWDNMVKWYHTQPFFTRTYLSVCVLFTVLISLNLISSYHVFYTFEATFFRLHIWRPLTAFLFIEKLDIVFVVSLCVMYFSLSSLERQIDTAAKYAEFLWMVGVLLVSCVVMGTLANVYFLSDMLIIALTYLSARKTPSQPIHLISNITIDSQYLPYGYIALMILFGHHIVNELIGLLLGAAYFQLQKLGERDPQRKYLAPPRFLVQYCERFMEGRRAG